MDRLIALDYSPWSEKARWALDFVRHTYHETNYQPLFGAIPLKAKTGRWLEKATVPVLLTADGAFCDSFAIAKEASRLHPDRALILKGKEAETAQWNERAERLATAGRAMILKRIMADPSAQKDYIPKLPRPLRALLGPLLARIGLAFFKRKYAIDIQQYEQHLQAMDEVLAQMRKALQQQEFLLGTFSFADIAMAAVLQFVKPVDPRYIPLNGASRVRWETPEMIEKYPELLAWRDRLYHSRHQG